MRGEKREKTTSRSEVSKMSLCLVLPHITTIGKADFAQRFPQFSNPSLYVASAL